MARYSPTVLPGEGVPTFGDIISGALDSFREASRYAQEERRRRREEARQEARDRREDEAYELDLDRLGLSRGRAPTTRVYTGEPARFELPASIERVTPFGMDRTPASQPDPIRAALEHLVRNGVQRDQVEPARPRLAPGAFVPKLGFVGYQPDQFQTVTQPGFRQITPDIYEETARTPRALDEADRLREQGDERFFRRLDFEAQRQYLEAEAQREREQQAAFEANQAAVRAGAIGQARSSTGRPLTAEQIRALAVGASFDDLGIERPMSRSEQIAAAREQRFLSDYETAQRRAAMEAWGRNLASTFSGPKVVAPSEIRSDLPETAPQLRSRLRTQFPSATEADLDVVTDAILTGISTEDVRRRRTEGLIRQTETRTEPDPIDAAMKKMLEEIAGGRGAGPGAGPGGRTAPAVQDESVLLMQRRVDELRRSNPNITPDEIKAILRREGLLR